MFLLIFGLNFGRYVFNFYLNENIYYQMNTNIYKHYFISTPPSH